jgi:hypothetical protein
MTNKAVCAVLLDMSTDPRGRVALARGLRQLRRKIEVRGSARVLSSRGWLTVAHDRATDFELLFDLVYVFAVTQVTGYMAHEQSPRGVLQGLLVLALF